MYYLFHLECTDAEDSRFEEQVQGKRQTNEGTGVSKCSPRYPGAGADSSRGVWQDQQLFGLQSTAA